MAACKLVEGGWVKHYITCWRYLMPLLLIVELRWLHFGAGCAGSSLPLLCLEQGWVIILPVGPHWVLDLNGRPGGAGH